MATAISLKIRFKGGGELIHNEAFETIEDAVDIAEALVDVENNKKEILCINIRWRRKLILIYSYRNSEWIWT